MTQFYMNQIEEFNKYYIYQVKEEDNPTYFELPNKEEKKNNLIQEEEKKINLINEEKQNDKIYKNYLINEEEEEEKIKEKKKEATIKRLKSLPKNYKTYKMEYKQNLVKKVSKLIYYYY